MKSILTAKSLSFELPNGRLLFENLDFSLERRLTALVGPNGIGKTILSKIISGELEPTKGSLRRLAPIVYFPQQEEPKEISVDEYLSAHYEWSPLGTRLLERIPGEKFCSTLSGGEWIRVRLARIVDSQFLILDEPTNNLDREGREALLPFLKNRKGGALLISHDRECLSLCEDVLELSHLGLSKFGGGWEAYCEARDAERERLARDLENAKRERDQAVAERNEKLERQDKRNRRGALMAKRGGIPKILLGSRKRRAQVTTGRLDAETMERTANAIREAFQALTELKVDPVMYADLVGQEIPSQKLVAEAVDFNIRFQDWLFPKDLNFSWHGGVRIALKGSNGSGKTTLLKAILGTEFKTRGKLRRGNLANLYIDQQCACLDESKSIYENVRESAVLTESETRNGLASFLFFKDAVFQKVGELSGGERLRAALAKGFLSQSKPDLLVLDEPTNNLDLVNIEFVENLVRQFRGAILIISHDEVFLKNCGVTQKLEVK